VPDPAPLREGDIAFAVNVQTIWDLLMGLYDMRVRLTRHSSPTEATLTLANRTAGGPILRFLDHTLENTTMEITAAGFTSARVGSYFDWAYQAVAPGNPTAGHLRVYSRDGNLYFKAPVGGEQQIPIGLPPGPSKRREYWYSGGG
jgi:hypothetical protein